MPTDPNKRKTTQPKPIKDPILTAFLTRREELKQARVNSGIEDIWRQAEADYQPHELGGPKKKHLVENIRTDVSTYTDLDKDNWRSKVAKNEPFIKIQTALSILFDRNPEAYFEPGSKRYEATTLLLQELYHKTWTNPVIGSKRELRKFIFNQAKYGWSPARRYYKRVVRKGMDVVDKFNTTTNDFEWKKQDIVDVDDVYFEAKSPWDCWIDDMAKPDDPRSRRDWMWRETFDEETFESLWPGKAKELNIKFTTMTDTRESDGKQKYTSSNLAEVWFYEKRTSPGRTLVVCQDELVSKSPIPRISQELSLVDTYWLLRSTDSPYGIGVNEIMRGNKVLLDRIRNMTIDQVVLSIYKMFFYSNSEQLDDEGGEDIRIHPGKGKKVIDPKNISWLVQPGPGQDAYTMIEMLKKDIEDDTGITRTLGGEVTGKNLGEVTEAKEGALKRLATPLRNIKSALEWDAKLCLDLMQMIYSVPKVFSFTDPELITEYVAQVNNDAERYFTDEKGVFNALKYREFQLNLEQGANGAYQKSEKSQFFMVKPSTLDWCGEITIRTESMVEMSKPLERQMKLEMSNLLLPLYGQIAQNPMLLGVYIKPIKEILKMYDQDPAKWLPAPWLAATMVTPMAVPAAAPGAEMPPNTNPDQAQRVVPQEQLTPASSTDQMMNSMAQKMSPQ